MRENRTRGTPQETDASRGRKNQAVGAQRRRIDASLKGERQAAHRSR